MHDRRTIEDGVYRREAAVPFALERVAAARHLLVSFSALHRRAGATAGRGGQPARRPPRSPVVHRCRRSLSARPWNTAGRRPHRHASRLADRRAALDPEARIIMVGSSFRALCALYIGLKARAGHIVAGGPPVLFGGWIARLHRALPPSPEATRVRAALVEMTGVDQDVETRAFFDMLILRAAQRAQHDALISLFASPRTRWSSSPGGWWTGCGRTPPSGANWRWRTTATTPASRFRSLPAFSGRSHRSPASWTTFRRRPLTSDPSGEGGTTR